MPMDMSGYGCLESGNMPSQAERTTNKSGVDNKRSRLGSSDDKLYTIDMDATSCCVNSVLVNESQ